MVYEECGSRTRQIAFFCLWLWLWETDSYLFQVRFFNGTLLCILKDFWSASDSEFLNHVTVFLSVVIWGLLAPRYLRRENYIICLHRGPDKSPLLLCSLGHTGWRHSIIQWNLMIKLGIYMESAFNSAWMSWVSFKQKQYFKFLPYKEVNQETWLFWRWTLYVIY